MVGSAQHVRNDAGRDRSTVLGRAADQARRLNHGWVGPDHYLLALLAEPSQATEALAELGVTYDRLDERLHNQTGDPDWPPSRYDENGLSPSAAAYKLEARAEGLALAWGYRVPEPEHFLLAMVYEDYGAAGTLHHLGASQPAILDALRRRGVRVPEVEPPRYRPWRGHHRIEVDEAELGLVIDLLTQQHPPGSQWRWGFNWLPGVPRRARVDAEEGIDLDAVLAQARRPASS
jgi:Clp amino terminal domain, pathogenicity island component